MTSSVTGCSTWSLAFSSMNQKPSFGEEELCRAGAHVAGGTPELDRRVADRAQKRPVRGRAAAPPRAPSGGGAGSSSRGRRGGRRRVRPRAAGPRRGGRPLHEPFAEHRSVAEGGLGLAPRSVERAVELVRPPHDAHPPPAPPGGGLQDERKSDLARRSGGKRRHARHGRPGAWPRACRRRGSSLPAAALPRSIRPTRPPRRSRRSPRGTRSRGERRRRRPLRAARSSSSPTR